MNTTRDQKEEPIPIDDRRLAKEPILTLTIRSINGVRQPLHSVGPKNTTGNRAIYNNTVKMIEPNIAQVCQSNEVGPCLRATTRTS